MRFATYSSPHGRGSASVTRVMAEVLLAMLPGIAAMVWYFGWGVVVNLVIATVSAVGFEALMLRLRKRPVSSACW